MHVEQAGATESASRFGSTLSLKHTGIPSRDPCFSKSLGFRVKSNEQSDPSDVNQQDTCATWDLALIINQDM